MNVSCVGVLLVRAVSNTKQQHCNPDRLACFEYVVTVSLRSLQ